MPITNTQLFYLFLAALLAFVFNLISNFFKTRNKRNKITENFLIYVSLELTSITKILEKLKTGLEYRSWFELIHTNKLKKSVQNLESVRREAIYFSDSERQVKFIDLISDVSGFIDDGENLERYYLDQRSKLKEKDELGNKSKNKKSTRSKPFFMSKKELDSYSEQQRITKLIGMLDLKRRIEDFTKNLLG